MSSGNQTGSGKGRKHNQRDKVFWAALCKKYVDSPKIGQTKFLQAEFGLEEGTKLTSPFGRWLRKYKAGNLRVDEGYATQTKRRRMLKFEDIEAKMVEYLDLRQRLYLTAVQNEQKVGLATFFPKGSRSSSNLCQVY